MKKLLKLSFAFLLILSSCSKDNNDDINEDIQNNGVSELLSNKLSLYARTATSTNQDDPYINDDEKCYSYVYPITFTAIGQPNRVINSEIELFDFFRSLSPIGPRYEILYPINVIKSDGNQVIINNSQEEYDLIRACFDAQNDPNNEPPSSCFSINYPVTVLDINNSQIAINSDQELYTTPGIIGFLYPISVTMQATEDVITINSDEEFDQLFNDCQNIEQCNNCPEVCFVINFPMSFVNETGEVTTVNNENELNAFMINQTTPYIITYPINVKLDNGAEQIINNDDEFITLLDSCN